MVTLSTKAVFKRNDAKIQCEADLSDPIDISIPLHFNSPPGACAFCLPAPKSSELAMGSFVLSVASGCPVNVNALEFNVHGSCTHTESIRHIKPHTSPVHTNDEFAPKSCWSGAALLSVAPQTLADCGECYLGSSEATDLVLSRANIQAAVNTIFVDVAVEDSHAFCRAVVLRTGMAAHGKDWSKTNPPYPTSDAIRWLLERFPDLQHIILDVPSLDREEDGGTTPNHKIFFGATENDQESDQGFPLRFVTELTRIPDEAEQGMYLLNLQVAPFVGTDAVPARPVLHRVTSFVCS